MCGRGSMSQHGNARRGGGGGPVRDFYLEHPAVAALSEAEVTAVRHELGIRVLAPDSGDGSQRKLIHAPVASFLQASFPSYLLEALEAAEFRVPTAIQRQVWPIVMSGHDLIGLAETGSGKTLAFLLRRLCTSTRSPSSHLATVHCALCSHQRGSSRCKCTRRPFASATRAQFARRVSSADYPRLLNLTHCDALPTWSLRRRGASAISSPANEPI